MSDSDPKWNPLAGKVEDLAAKIQALIKEALEAGFREGVAWSAEFLGKLATHDGTPEPVRPLYEQARDALRLGLLDVPTPDPAGN